MAPSLSRVWLVTLGATPPQIEHAVAGAVRRALECGVRKSVARIDTAFAFDAQRGQLSSALLLDALAPLAFDPAERVLAITGEDLFIPVLTYVFGEAHLNGPAAIISTHRLDPVFYGLPPNPALLEVRAGIEAVHELGHTLGLVHCSEYTCAMHASHVADEIDLKRAVYCNECTALLQK